MIAVFYHWGYYKNDKQKNEVSRQMTYNRLTSII